jgi:prepilin-type N-terminal cleavage/methylation domain-containing protein
MRHGHFHGNGKSGRGFTLLEVIVALIVASILGAMLVNFMGSNMMQSANPIIYAQNGAFLNQILENMTADYKNLLRTSATPMATFISRIGAEGTSQSYYADVSHPYTVVNNHRISFPAGSPATEQADGSGKILKVTVEYRTMSITALFSE